MILGGGMTLSKKVILLTTAVLIPAIAVFSFLGMRAVNRATETMLQDRLTTTQLVADYVDEALGKALARLEDTAGAINYPGNMTDLDMQIGYLEYRYSQLAIYTYGIYLLDTAGRVVWSQPEVSGLAGMSLAAHPVIGPALDSGQSSISGLTAAPLTEAPVILLTGPIGAEQTGGRGLLVVAIDLTQSSIGGFVRPIRLGQTGYVELVDQNGMVVARTEPGPTLAPFEKSDHSGRFAALIEAGEPTRGVCHTCHEPLLRVERKDVLAFVPLSQAHWGVVIRQSEEEALAPTRELARNLLIFGGGLGLVALMIVAMTTRNIVRRIRTLTGASRKIAEGDLTSPVNTLGQDEVSTLARTLDEMRLKLQTSYGALERKTKELSSLLSVSSVISSPYDQSSLYHVLGRALDKTLEIMDSSAGGILLLDEEKQKLCYHLHRGLSQQYVNQVCLRPGEGIAGKVAQTGEAILLEDITRDPRAANHDLIVSEGIRAFASVPLRSKDKVVGVINIASHRPRQFSADDVKVLEGIAGQVAVAIDNFHLHQEVQRKEEMRGELLSEIFTVQEEERKRIARELHDETSQALASLVARLEAVVGILPPGTTQAKTGLRKAQSLAVSMLDGIHKLIYELRPTLLDDLGLVAATRWLADNKLKVDGITVDFKTAGREKRLPPKVEATLFRLIQEAVNNVVRHAQASHASISLQFKRAAVRASVTDDGQGFDVEEAISSRDRPRGLGLLGMMERTELVNGTLHIRSHSGGGGTKIDIEIPLN
ncbi:MAG: GAF domain-containing protein [Chloroflexota bacterium]